MQVRMADLPAQNKELQPELIAAMQEVIESGYFVNGTNVKALESEIASYCASTHGLSLNSGTDALLMALLASGVGPGDEVITPPFTFVATAETVALAGATPVFADIDPVSFNLCPKSTEARITSKTKAIIPVHLFGQPANMSAFKDIAKQQGLTLIADGAQSIGATYRGDALGKWSDLLTLSFFPTKNLGALGDGGMVLTDNPEQAEKIRLLRSHGSGGTYSYDEIGYCSRLDELQAAFLRVKFKHIESWNDARRGNAALYNNCLDDLTEQIALPTEDENTRHVYHQYTIRVRNNQRQKLQKHLSDKGVFCAIYYPGAIHLEPAYRHLGCKRGDFPEAELAADQVLSLPVHPNVTHEQIEYTAAAIREFFTQTSKTK